MCDTGWGPHGPTEKRIEEEDRRREIQEKWERANDRNWRKRTEEIDPESLDNYPRPASAGLFKGLNIYGADNV